MAGAQEVQQVALEFANDMAANMNELANTAIDFASQPVEWNAYWNAPNYVEGYRGTVVGMDGVNLPSITAARPNAPVLSAVTVPSFGEAPQFLMAEPIINIPNAPSNVLPAAPGAAPVFVTPEMPNMPAFSLPATPQFQNIIVPDLPAVEYPAFTSTLPIDDIVAPSEVFSYAEQPYQSAMLDALKAKLMFDLTNGGYGIDTDDAMRLWEQTRERELLGAEAAIQEASRQVAARGFMMPPGALNAIISEAQLNAAQKTSSASRDIMVKKADLFVQNRQFTIQQVKEVEQIMITYTGYMAERALNTAKAVVEMGIAGFNARVAKANYALDKYKAAASVYSELIRAATLKLEAYKAQVEGARLTADVQRIHAEVYKTQVDGVQALVSMYATQMQAAKTASEIERLKLDAFRTSIDTYAAQVGAKTAEFGMFESQIKGEMAKVSVHQTAVQTYATQVDAFKAKLSAGQIVTQAQVQSNTLQLDAYRADIQRYATELEKAQIELSQTVAHYEANVRNLAVVADAHIRQSQQNVEAGKANADVAVAYAHMLIESAQRGAQIEATRAASAASTMGSVAGAYGNVSAAALSAATGITAQITS